MTTIPAHCPVPAAQVASIAYGEGRYVRVYLRAGGFLAYLAPAR